MVMMCSRKSRPTSRFYFICFIFSWFWFWLAVVMRKRMDHNLRTTPSCRESCASNAYTGYTKIRDLHDKTECLTGYGNAQLCNGFGRAGSNPVSVVGGVPEWLRGYTRRISRSVFSSFAFCDVEYAINLFNFSYSVSIMVPFDGQLA